MMWGSAFFLPMTASDSMFQSWKQLEFLTSPFASRENTLPNAFPDTELEAANVESQREASAESPIDTQLEAEAEIETPAVPSPTSPIVAVTSTTPAPASAPTAPNPVVATPQAASPRKNKPVGSVKRIVQQHWKLALVCAASMLLGIILNVLLFDSVPAETLASEAPAKVIYTAANARRIEPISPIVPFEELNKDVVELGRRLFQESALSGNGKYSCATCHDLDSGGADGQKTSRGVGGQHGLRNTPTIYNAAFNFVQNWDGRSETLEQQLDEHLSETGEMLSDWSRVIKVLKQDPLYNRTFQLHMGSEPSEALVREAIATYERSLVTTDSKFDLWLRGNDQALNSDEIAGYYLFKQLNCISCHQGPGAGGTMLQPLGGMQKYFESLDNQGKLDEGKFTATQHERDRNVFRVPSLRNVELTAPYFHDGSAATLTLAVQTMMEYQLGLKPNPVDVDRIVAFLKTLTGKPIAL